MDRPAGELTPPADGDDWVGLGDAALPLEAVGAWVPRADCGAVVTFTGNVRDVSDGRAGVTALHYEAYEDYVIPRLLDLVGRARSRWLDLGRVACLHRVGDLAVGDCAVVVAVSSGHRDHAFEAARWCIDTLKDTLPIWKRETWADGEDWGTGARPVTEVAS